MKMSARGQPNYEQKVDQLQQVVEVFPQIEKHIIDRKTFMGVAPAWNPQPCWLWKYLPALAAGVTGLLALGEAGRRYYKKQDEAGPGAPEEPESEVSTDESATRSSTSGAASEAAGRRPVVQPVTDLPVVDLL